MFIENNSINNFFQVIPLVIFLLFFIVNSFLIGIITKKFMNTVSLFSRFMIGSMFLWIILLIFESISALFKLNYNQVISDTNYLDVNNKSFFTIGFLFFILIQGSLLLFYTFNWKCLKINFNLNISQLLTFFIILIFLLGFYYGFIFQKIDNFKLTSGSAFFEQFKMIIAFSNWGLFENNIAVQNFVIAHGVNVFLIILMSASISSFTILKTHNFYLIFKKIAIALFFASLFLTMKNIPELINFLFVIPYLLMLFGFYWNDKDILVNDNDKNNVLILAIITIINFNYWFVIISLIIAFLFTIFAFKRATTIAISEFSRILNFSFLLVSLSFASFRYPINDNNNSVFVFKILISTLFLILFGVMLVIYNFVKKNQNFRNSVFKIQKFSLKNFDYILGFLLIIEYIILLVLFFLNQTIQISSTNNHLENLQAFFSFFIISQENIDIFILLLILWSFITAFFIFSIFSKKILKNENQKNFIFKNLNFNNFNSNIIFISFIAIAFIFNPFFFPLVKSMLKGPLIQNGFFELNDLESKISFLNIIWVTPFLVTLSRLNEKGFGYVKNYYYLFLSEFLFIALILVYPVLVIVRS